MRVIVRSHPRRNKSMKIKRDKRVELLAPAGSFQSVVAAVNAGADAVYMGGRRFGARAYADSAQAEGEDMGDGCRADLGDPDQAMRCLALQALESRGEEAMVISDKGICYELIAKYLEVDGEPHILELLRRIKTQ